MTKRSYMSKIIIFGGNDLTAIGWRPIQGVPRLSHNVSWDRIQLPCKPVWRISGFDNVWILKVTLTFTATDSTADPAMILAVLTLSCSG